MYKNILLISALLALSACGPQVEADGNPPGSNSNKPQVDKNIEAGEDLKFFCRDYNKNTEVKISAIWLISASRWQLTLLEQDGSGKEIQRIGNLVAFSDSAQFGQMNITFNSMIYGKINQVNSNQARFEERGRVIACLFN